jgi:hypothetical protein
MKMIKAPKEFYEELSTVDLTIFLGGSIEMGAAEQWQERVAKRLESHNVLLLNPRRDDWDSTWVQDPTPGTQFHEQVMWELDAQQSAMLLVYYFDANTKSPITLLELGLHADQGIFSTIVCCPKEFYRYGNVAMVCDLWDIPLVHTFDEMISLIEPLIVVEQ